MNYYDKLCALDSPLQGVLINFEFIGFRIMFRYYKRINL